MAKKRARRLPDQVKGKPHWTVQVVPRLLHRPRGRTKDFWGDCSPWEREIRISRKGAKYGITRDTLVHELLHKIMWWMREPAVLELDRAINPALDKKPDADRVPIIRHCILKHCRWMRREAAEFIAHEIDDALDVFEDALETLLPN